jgi:hypothetical protein
LLEINRTALRQPSFAHPVSPRRRLAIALLPLTAFLMLGPRQVQAYGDTAMASTTSMSIHAFLRTSHNVMPDYRLTGPRIDDVSACILDLRTQTP